MSHIAKTKLHFTINRLWVLALLGWSKEQYLQLQYERGIEYLAEYLQLDAATARAFEDSQTWWRWWVNQWHLRDANVFLPGALSVPCAETLYLQVHSLWFIDAHPSAALMDESYNRMTKQLFAELVKTGR